MNEKDLLGRLGKIDKRLKETDYTSSLIVTSTGITALGVLIYQLFSSINPTYAYCGLAYSFIAFTALLAIGNKPFYPSILRRLSQSSTLSETLYVVTTAARGLYVSFIFATYQLTAMGRDLNLPIVDGINATDVALGILLITLFWILIYTMNPCGIIKRKMLKGG